jgi:hypothetical protein
MTASPITAKQLKRLQTLWGLFCRQANLDAKDRAARLEWAAGAIGRQTGSFRELTADEANIAIDAIQKHLPPELLKRKRPSRRLAQAYGTAGRRGRDEKEVRLVDAETWRLLDVLLARLGWTRERLDGFLKSRKSPVRSGAIYTIADANRLIWALKNMSRRVA